MQAIILCYMSRRTTEILFLELKLASFIPFQQNKRKSLLTQTMHKTGEYIEIYFSAWKSEN